MPKKKQKQPKIEFKTCENCGRKVAKPYFKMHRCKT